MLRRTVAGTALSAAAAAAITVGGVHLVTADAATATTGVNIRSGPGTSYGIVGGLARGQSITAVGKPHNGWVKVSFNGGTAYVSAQYLDLSGAVSSATPVTIYTQGNKIASATLNVRSSPSLTSKIIGYISDGQAVSLTGKQSKGFAEVLYGGQRAWVTAQYLISSVNGLPNSSGTRVATTDLLIRTSDDANFKIITTVPRGSTLKITGATSNGYAQVIYGNAIRWVTAKYLSSNAKAGPVAPPETSSSGSAGSQAKAPRVIGSRYATTELLVRTSSGRGDKTVATVQRGDKVKITGAVANGRAEVVYDGVSRWVTAQYLSTNRPRSGPSTGSANSTSGSSGAVSTSYHGGSTNVPNGVWDDLAMCESSGNWSIDTGNGFYGGLQFTLQTWRGFGGSGMPNNAGRDEQIRIAERVLAVQGWKAWPACSTKLGLR
ncbi:SH3 domain-containing protein [Microlunatus sp. Gsoil 973]|uniref:SH3 domain-containing protein n=1 Tax=Microlunatus sp. Gsoil 973 TaxID=2672569 RepID=UPI00272E97D0|nr:SH3 domain-containing protein [Microlunatus sp. Gsoil 973]